MFFRFDSVLFRLRHKDQLRLNAVRSRSVGGSKSFGSVRSNVNSSSFVSGRFCSFGSGDFGSAAVLFHTKDKRSHMQMKTLRSDEGRSSNEGMGRDQTEIREAEEERKGA